jgi:hypothetical protein
MKMPVVLAAKQRTHGSGAQVVIRHGGDGVSSERHILQLLLVLGACVFIAAALMANGGSAMLSLFACLACGTRIERNHGRGDYGRTPPESLE